MICPILKTYKTKSIASCSADWGVACHMFAACCVLNHSFAIWARSVNRYTSNTNCLRLALLKKGIKTPNSALDASTALDGTYCNPVSMAPPAKYFLACANRTLHPIYLMRRVFYEIITATWASLCFEVIFEKVYR